MTNGRFWFAADARRMKSSWAFRYGTVHRQTTGFGLTELPLEWQTLGRKPTGCFLANALSAGNGGKWVASRPSACRPFL
jgi:hypothetical protein